MGAANIAIGVLIVAWIVVRQLRQRPVREAQPYRLTIILGLVGVVQLSSYLGTTTVRPVGFTVLIAGLLLGAVLGAARGQAMHLWRDRRTLVRKGNLTVAALWVVGTALHVGIDLVMRHVDAPADRLGSVSLLLYLAVTLGAQQWVLMQRATRIAVQRSGEPRPDNRGAWAPSERQRRRR